MDWLTILVAIIGVAGIVALPPRRGLLVFLAVALLYPDFMRLYLGTVEINPHRIMLVVLLLKCLAAPTIRRHFHWNQLDTAVVLAAFAYAATLLFTTPFDKWLQNRCGDTIDTVFVYLVFRLIVTDRAALVSVVKTIGVLLIPLAALGVSEALWAQSPYLTLANYSTHVSHDFVYEVRHGFNRAGGPWVSSIMFGLMFASFIPLVLMLRFEAPPWKMLSRLLCAVAIVGLLSTMSTGPYMMLIIVTFCLWLERHKRLVRPILTVALVGCVLVETISNRHFYDVLADMIAMDSGNAWYRSQLMRMAIQDLPNYWLAGYGFADPGWGFMIDERGTDGCNDYVVHAAVHGLPGLLAFVGILVTAMYTTVKAQGRTADPWLRSYAWALGSIMVGLMLAYFTVSPFKIMMTVFYMLLGLQAALREFPAGRPAPRNRRPMRVHGASGQPVVVAPQAFRAHGTIG